MQSLPDWYLAKVSYFQQLGFFQEIGADADSIARQILVQSQEHYYGPILNLDQDELFEQILLSYDTQRVWFIEDYMVLGQEPAFRNDFYTEVFRRLINLTNGLFQPQNLTIAQCGYCDGRDKRLMVDFEWEGQMHQLIFCIDLEVLVVNFLAEINELLASTGHCFRVWKEGYGNCLVLFIPTEIARALEIQRGWEFTLLAYYWLDKAQYIHKQLESERAQEYYRKAFETIPNDPHVGSEFAWFLSDFQQYAEAKIVYEQTIERLATKGNLNNTEQWWLTHLNGQLQKLDT
ncbi:hypothetical protein BKI52_29100 [marine bacterium AO1-C]|nr:hypothetical protein BKI52_29100 [marine bacterium AO1-C]